MALLLLPLVVIAAIGAVALGVRVRDVLLWAGTAVVVLFVLSVVSVGLLAGTRSDDDDGGGGDSGRATPTIEAEPDESQQVEVQFAPVRPIDGELRQPDDSEFPARVAPLAGLADGDAVYLEAALDGDAVVRQCPSDDMARAQCGVGTAVPAPEDGLAQFLFVVEADLDTPDGTVDCSSQACAVTLLGSEGEVLGSLPLVFGAASASPTISVTGQAPYSAGESARVTLAGFAPGEEVVVTQCTPPGSADGGRCGAPAPEVRVQVDDEGGAVVAYGVHLGPVGADGRECRRSQPCAIAVLGSSTPVNVSELSLAGSTASDVTSGRVAAALLLAALLLLGCAVLVATGDWGPVDGDPFEGIVLRVPEGWEHLRPDDLEDDDGADDENRQRVTG
jgi:hypothetical protein